MEKKLRDYADGEVIPNEDPRDPATRTVRHIGGQVAYVEERWPNGASLNRPVMGSFSGPWTPRP